MSLWAMRIKSWFCTRFSGCKNVIPTGDESMSRFQFMLRSPYSCVEKLVAHSSARCARLAIGRRMDVWLSPYFGICSEGSSQVHNAFECRLRASVRVD
jgi:hypothetical protein